MKVATESAPNPTRSLFIELATWRGTTTLNTNEPTPMPDQHAIKNAIPDLTRSELVAHVRAFVAIARADSDSHRSWVFRPELLEPEALESTPNRKQIRNIVGGWLTTSSMEMLPGYTMYVHDEALMVPEPTLNFMATMLYNTGHPICGTIVLVPNQTRREDAP